MVLDDFLSFFIRFRFPANKTNEGRYTCVAENEVGTDQKHLDLFVSGNINIFIIYPY